MSEASMANPFGRHHAESLKNPIPAAKLLREKGWPPQEASEAAQLRHWTQRIDACVLALYEKARRGFLSVTEFSAPGVTR